MRAPCSAALVRWEDIVGPVDVVDAIDMMSTVTLCRDDRCNRCDPHPAHPVRAKRDRTVYDVDPLDEIVYSHVHDRECRTV